MHRGGWVRVPVRVRLLATSVAAMSLIASVVGIGSSVAAEPVITVSPNVGLVDGQEITVTGSGSIPDADVEVVVCVAGDTDCGRWFGYAESSGGGFVITDTVRALVPDSAGDLVDCRSVPCELVVTAWTFDPEQHVELARIVLDFDPEAPLLAPPTVSAAPDQDLVHGQVVAVTGTGHKPNSPVYIEECPGDPGPEHRCRTIGFEVAGGDGSFTASVEVTSVLPAGYMAVGDRLDCRAASGSCTLVATTDWGSAVAPLHFDPEGPLPPGPSITVSPATDLVEGDTVSVAGSGFAPSEPVGVSFCLVGTPRCDLAVDVFVVPEPDGSFVTDVVVHDEVVDHGGFSSCTAAPGCEIRVAEWMSGEVARASVAFRPRTGPVARYLDPVFAEVQKIEGIVYRQTTDVDGNPIDLALDLYLPMGDTVGARPSVVWMFGGWFMFGDRTQLTAYAMDSARRGYVGVAIDYRIRPDMSLAQVLEAAADAEEDARAAVAWLKANAATYGLDPDAVVASGVSAGAVLAWNLAYGASDADPSPSPVAGAVPISGVPLSGPEVGAPPVIAFHGDADDILPIGPDRDTCPKAAAVGSVCELVEFPGGDHYVAQSEARTIIARTYAFLAEHVLAPLGYFDPVPPAPPGPRPAPVRPEVVGLGPNGSGPSTTDPGPAPTTPQTSAPTVPTTVVTPQPTPSATVPDRPGPDGPGNVGPSAAGAARPARPVVARPTYAG